MLVPVTSSECEIEIKRSRFIGIAVPISSDLEARKLIRDTWKKYQDASHVVHAFILGRHGDIFSMSDDHEPRNTAGRPILEILKGSGITNIMVMVVRYFGGTKLGTGGLVHAYGQTAKEVLSLVKTEELIDKTAFSLEFGYELYDQIKKLLLSCSSQITDEQFDTAVRITGTIPESEFQAASRQVSDISSGKVKLIALSSVPSS